MANLKPWTTSGTLWPRLRGAARGRGRDRPPGRARPGVRMRRRRAGGIPRSVTADHGMPRSPARAAPATTTTTWPSSSTTASTPRASRDVLRGTRTGRSTSTRAGPCARGDQTADPRPGPDPAVILTRTRRTSGAGAACLGPGRPAFTSRVRHRWGGHRMRVCPRDRVAGRWPRSRRCGRRCRRSCEVEPEGAGLTTRPCRSPRQLVGMLKGPPQLGGRLRDVETALVEPLAAFGQPPAAGQALHGDGAAHGGDAAPAVAGGHGTGNTPSVA
jgi:hypothetical protein